MPDPSQVSYNAIPLGTVRVVGTTLESHIMGGMRGAPGATGEFTSLLNNISLAVRIIHARVRSAGLAGLLGYTGETNVQGEEVQKLDEHANDVLCTVLQRSRGCIPVGRAGYLRLIVFVVVVAIGRFRGFKPIKPVSKIHRRASLEFNSASSMPKIKDR